MKRLFTLLAALTLAAASAAATTEVPPSLAAAITAARASVESGRLDTGPRQSATRALDDAAAYDDEASAAVAQASQWREQAATPLPPAPPAVASLTERRRQIAQWSQRLPANPSADALERLLASERTQVDDTRHALDAVQRELTDLISRPSPAPAELAALRQRAEAAAPVAANGEPAALTQARALRHQADQRRALGALALRETEQATAENRQTRLERQAAALRLQEAEHQPRVAWLVQRIAAQATRQLTEQRDALAALPHALPPGPSRELAEANAALAQDLLGHGTQLAAERAALAEQVRTRDQVTAALRDTEARLRVGGNGDAIGQWLWQQRLALPSMSSLRIQRQGVQETLGRLRLDLFNSASRSNALGGDSPAAGVLAVLGEGSSAPPPGADPDTVRSGALRATEADLQHQLEPLLRRRIEVLEQSDAALQTIADDGDALQKLMARQLLWMPSHAPIGTDWLARWADAPLLPWDVAGAWRLMRQHLPQHALAGLLAALLVGLTVALRRRAVQRLTPLAGAVAHPAHDRFRLTLAALGWSLLVAVPAPLAAWLLGQRVQQMAAGSHPGLDALGQSLQALAGLLLMLALVHVLLRPNGLAQAHLQWPPERLHALRRVWLAALAVAVPTRFVTLLALLSDQAATIDTWARLAVLVQGAGLALVAGALGRRLAPSAAQATVPMRRIGALLLPIGFAATALMAAGGYVYSAVVVQQALLNSVAVLLAVAVFDGLLRRWLLLSEQRLARRQKAQAHGGEAVRDMEGGDTPAEEDSALTLVTISAQTRRLLRLLRIVLILLGMTWAWFETLPALLRFEDIQLWTSDDRGVTLMDVLGALLLLALTASLARNLPGLLEIALTPHRRISAAGRYTVTTLARYAVVIVGVLLAFSALGLRWSQLQWLAAALTVGLGFGLQEIFANFVSGLILLVERPFRVGDTITIGDLTGTVTRIHTRATTVLDYDNKEIVIPNKTFITGQVTNWTLSDNVTRLTLNVGVAYGSPPEQVRELLLATARAHPLVLPEPPPNAWFMTLGASTLDFELRVYVAALGDRLPVRNALLTRLTEALAEAGIDIAFPQMDVHVRDLPPPPPAEPKPA